jgi:hypothetical protein
MHILETPRLILRELVPDDVDALARILSDRETMRFYPTSFDRPAVKDWIARNRTRYAKDGHGLWAMTLKSTGELIGDCGLTVQDVVAQTESKSVTTSAAITGGRVSQRNPPAPAVTSDLHDSRWTAWSRSFARKICRLDVWQKRLA